jgi:hypothetical protein
MKKRRMNSLYNRDRQHENTMKLSVGKKYVNIKSHTADEIMKEVQQSNVPFVVKSDGGDFTTRQRVFFSNENVRVECENEHELRFACKLVEEDIWQNTDVRDLEEDTLACIDETKKMEKLIEARMQEPEEIIETEPTEEEDISIEEWGQLGYNWFERDEVVYM